MSLGQIGGGAGGAGIGAMIGSIVPGIGTAMGALIGFSIGSMIGGMVDPPRVKTQKIKPAGINLQTSEYGLTIPYITGTRKVAGNCLWVGNFQSHKHKRDNGGKGGGGGGEAVYYTYTVSVAFGLTINECTLIRAWAGKKEININEITFYDGTQIIPNAHIQSILSQQGKTRFPVWKKLCYVVLQDYDLGENNLIPNFTFEISRGGGVSYRELEYRAKWGTAGGGEGKLNNPTYIRSVGDYVYLCDSGNGRIQKFGNGGNFQKVIKAGLNSPGGFEVDQFSIYIAETGANRVIWCPEVDGRVNQEISIASPRDICSVTTNKKYVIGYSDGQTKLYKLEYVYENDYSYIWQVSSTTNLGAWVGTSITFDGTYFYIADSTNNLVKKYNQNGGLILSFGGSGEEDGKFDKLFGVYASTGSIYNYIYCVDHKTTKSENRLQLFTPAGEFAIGTGSFGTTDGKFDDPSGVLVKEGYVYVCDTNNNRIQKFVDTKKGGISSYPSDISQDILTSDFYGAGLPLSNLNLDTFTETTNACTTDDMALDVLYDRQQSVLDVLQNIIMHHDGMITYYDGKINHIQLNENSSSILTLNEGDFVKQDGSPYLHISNEGVNATFNKVVIEYINEEKEYTPATTYADDMPDIDRNGLNEITINMEAFNTHARANKMAQRILNKFRSNLKLYRFKLGIKTFDIIGIIPGAVITINDTHTENSSRLVRIISLTIGEGYTLVIEAKEEIPQNYQVVVIGSGNKERTDLPQLTAPASSVLFPMIFETPALWANTNSYLITYTAPDEVQWAGASLYRSYLPTSGYQGIGTSRRDGTTGVIVEVGETSGGIKYIDVALNSDDTLESATDFDELISTPGINLAVISTSTRNVYLRFATVELIDTDTWRLSELIYDLVHFPTKNSYGNIASGNVFAYLETKPFVKRLQESELDRKLYFKAPSFNTKGAGQDLSNVDYLTLETTAMAARPLSPCNIKINGIGIDTSNAISVASGDIVISFSSRNRRNRGGTNYQWAYAIKEDADFDSFVLEIYNGATLLRTVEQTGKTFTYTAAMQSADGGISPYLVKIKQQNISRVSDYSDTVTITVV